MKFQTDKDRMQNKKFFTIQGFMFTDSEPKDQISTDGSAIKHDKNSKTIVIKSRYKEEERVELVVTALFVNYVMHYEY